VISKKEQEIVAKQFSKGDRVKIVVTESELREKQVEHGCWTESIAQVMINRTLPYSKFIIFKLFIYIIGDWRGWHRF